MAQFCPYEGRKCKDCPHHRFDEDYRDMACFVKQDMLKEKYEKEQTRAAKVAIQRQNKNKEEDI